MNVLEHGVQEVYFYYVFFYRFIYMDVLFIAWKFVLFINISEYGIWKCIYILFQNSETQIFLG